MKAIERVVEGAEFDIVPVDVVRVRVQHLAVRHASETRGLGLKHRELRHVELLSGRRSALDEESAVCADDSGKVARLYARGRVGAIRERRARLLGDVPRALPTRCAGEAQRCAR